MVPTAYLGPMLVMKAARITGSIDPGRGRDHLERGADDRPAPMIDCGARLRPVGDHYDVARLGEFNLVRHETPARLGR